MTTQLQTVLDALSDERYVTRYSHIDEAIAIVRGMMSVEPVDSFVRNCTVITSRTRAYDGPLFTHTPHGVIARLDGYTIIPSEDYIAAPQAVPALDESEVEDLARSAFESAMSFGIDLNSYERLAKHIWKKMYAAAPAVKDKP